MDVLARFAGSRRPTILILNASHIHDFIRVLDEFGTTDYPGAETGPQITVSHATFPSEAQMPEAFVQSLAREIAREYYHYDGFVVWGGVPSMVANATMLSFTLENLGKPVALTSSVHHQRTKFGDDFRYNLVGACLFVAGMFPGQVSIVCDVVIFFGSKVFRGCRAILESVPASEPFVSPRFPCIAEVNGARAIFNSSAIAPVPRGRFVIHTSRHLEPVMLLNVTASLSPLVVRALLAGVPSRVRAVLALGFGVGNMPTSAQGPGEPSITDVLREVHDRGGLVVVGTEVRFGKVNIRDYAVAKNLAKFAISAYDMTLDAAICKLRYLLTYGDFSNEQLAHLMGNVSLRGEISRPRLHMDDSKL